MYIIQEIQTESGNTALLPALTYATKNEAESAFHSKLSAAAVSAVDVHTVLFYDEHGNVLRREFYEHIAQEE